MAKVVLVVDDANTIRSLAKFALEKAGYSVIEATDGLEGLKASQSQGIDLIITDLNMPNMNGMEMSRKIKETASTNAIPIFMLTTEANEDVARKGKEIGILAWIVKPFVPEKLLAAVKKIIGE